MNKLTRAVARGIPALEMRMFQEPDSRERWAEIRQLATEQVADDVPAVRRDRVGRTWVGHAGVDGGREPWGLRRTTEEQQQLEVRMAPLLRELTPKQAETIRLLYFSQLTERDAAQVLGRSRATVREHRDTALAKLRARITELYLTDE